jgi:hypothetical protein
MILQCVVVSIPLTAGPYCVTATGRLYGADLARRMAPDKCPGLANGSRRPQRGTVYSGQRQRCHRRSSASGNKMERKIQAWSSQRSSIFCDRRFSGIISGWPFITTSRSKAGSPLRTIVAPAVGPSPLSIPLSPTFCRNSEHQRLAGQPTARCWHASTETVVIPICTVSLSMLQSMLTRRDTSTSHPLLDDYRLNCSHACRNASGCLRKWSAGRGSIACVTGSMRCPVSSSKTGCSGSSGPRYLPSMKPRVGP